MQLNLAFLDPPDPAASSAPSRRMPIVWEQLDEAGLTAARDLFARMIARMMAEAPLKEIGHE